MRVFARSALATAGETSCDSLLLEGEWQEPRGRNRWSLDRAIDGERSWIDAEASRLAEMVENAIPSDAVDDALPTAGYINALRLRYYLVKLLRVVVFFDEVAPLLSGSDVWLHVETPRDHDYILLFADLAAAKGWRLHVVEERDAAELAGSAPAENAVWRRLAARSDSTANRWLGDHRNGPRVVLCGNPRVLDPVCDALVRRDTQVVWLHERWAARNWWRWRPRGVRQWTCRGAEESSSNRLPEVTLRNVTFRGVSFEPVIANWISRRNAECGSLQAGWIAAIRRHFSTARPDAIILDQDATPFARSVVFAAREAGIATSVVQHGAPAIRFGFAPLAADQFFAWGESTRKQLEDWGVEDARIRCVGHTGAAKLAKKLLVARNDASAGAPNVLLLATTPPRDERPDAVSYHLTTETHREMFRAAFAAVARVQGARLTVKLHPRGPRLDVLNELRAQFPNLDVRVVRERGLPECLKDAACVLSCGSTAGIEALWSRAPVIQLAPQGSCDFLKKEQWGMLGVARTEQELDTLLAEALAHPVYDVDTRPIFGEERIPAADAIALHVLKRTALLRSA